MSRAASHEEQAEDCRGESDEKGTPSISLPSIHQCKIGFEKPLWL